MSATKRLSSIDTLRFFAIWAVLIIHAHYYYWSTKTLTGWAEISDWLLHEATSLAVPFFFILSGYFFGKSFLKEKNITPLYLRQVKRLLIAFLGWSFIYSLDSFQMFSTDQWQVIKHYGLIHAYYWHIQHTYLKAPIALLMTGTAGHLWFISALIQSLTLIFLFIWLNREKALIYFAVLLYLLAPVANLYLTPPSGYDYNNNPMTGPFFSTLPIVLGWWFSKQKEYRYSTAFLLLIIGGTLTGIKLAAHIYNLHLNALGYLDVNFLLIPFGLLMIALLNFEWGADTVLPQLGRMTLGIYCVHPLVMQYLTVLKGLTTSFLGNIVLLALTYLISLFIVLILKTIPFTRKLAV